MTDEINNSAVVKIIANHTREYNDLLRDYNELMAVHLKAVNDCSEIESKRYDLRKDNVELRKLLKQATKDCKVAQESLDGAQREIERLNEKIETLYDCGDDLRNFNLLEGKD